MIVLVAVGLSKVIRESKDCVCVCVHLCMCFAHVTFTECYEYQTCINVTEMDHDNRIKVTNVMVHDESDTAVASMAVAVIAC